MNKHSQVLAHLQKRGSITSWEAIQEYGATRLSAIIFDLKKKGYNIQTIMMESTDRNGETSRYARYILKNSEQE